MCYGMFDIAQNRKREKCNVQIKGMMLHCALFQLEHIYYNLLLSLTARNQNHLEQNRIVQAGGKANFKVTEKQKRLKCVRVTQP